MSISQPVSLPFNCISSTNKSTWRSWALVLSPCWLWFVSETSTRLFCISMRRIRLNPVARTLPRRGLSIKASGSQRNCLFLWFGCILSYGCTGRHYWTSSSRTSLMHHQASKPHSNLWSIPHSMIQQVLMTTTIDLCRLTSFARANSKLTRRMQVAMLTTILIQP